MNYQASTDTAGYGNRTITAFFDDRGEADAAVERLADAGVPRDQIRLVAGNGESSTTAGQNGKEGGGFWDTLADLFMPGEDRYTYAEGLRRGGYLVTVTAGAAD